MRGIDELGGQKRRLFPDSIDNSRLRTVHRARLCLRIPNLSWSVVVVVVFIAPPLRRVRSLSVHAREMLMAPARETEDNCLAAGDHKFIGSSRAFDRLPSSESHHLSSSLFLLLHLSTNAAASDGITAVPQAVHPSQCSSPASHPNPALSYITRVPWFLTTISASGSYGAITTHV